MTIPPVIIIRGDTQRKLLRRAADEMPVDTVVRFCGIRRSHEQNAKMWAMIHDVMRAEPEGRVHSPDVWKAIFMHALDRECLFVPALDGRSVFPIGQRSSELSVREMSDLLEIIAEYGSRHGVAWTEQEE